MHTGKRIALIIYGSLETVSGGYLYDRQLVRYLRKRGDRVDVISLPRRGYWRCLLDNLHRRIHRRLASEKYDVILQDELNHPSLFRQNAALRRTAGCPLIAVVHHLRCDEQHPSGFNFIYRRIEAAYLNSVDAFIFNSRATRESVRRLRPDMPPAVIARPGGDHLPAAISETVLRRRCRREPFSLNLLAVGNVIPRKGIHTIIDALARLPEVGWQLTVCGSLSAAPTYVQRIRKAISRSGFNERVHLTGTVDEKHLIRLMAAHDIFVLPSAHEGFGIVYLEAMRFGLPVLAAASGGAADVVRDGENGFLIAPGDVSDLSGIINQLINDRGKLENLSFAARGTALGFPAWDSSMRRAAGLIDRICKKDRLRRHRGPSESTNSSRYEIHD